MRSLSFWGGLDRVFELIVSQGGALNMFCGSLGAMAFYFLG